MSSKSSKPNMHHSIKMFLNGKADSAIYVEASRDLDKKKNAALVTKDFLTEKDISANKKLRLLVYFDSNSAFLIVNADRPFEFFLKGVGKLIPQRYPSAQKCGTAR